MFDCLIVEDSPVNWMILQNQMKKLGVATQVCTDGQHALDHCLTKGMPALILLDGYMPGMDGITFIKLLRKTPGGDRPYIVFCSSSLGRADIDTALKEGADCHFPKPISQEQLQSAIERARERAGLPAARQQG